MNVPHVALFGLGLILATSACSRTSSTADSESDAASADLVGANLQNADALDDRSGVAQPTNAEVATRVTPHAFDAKAVEYHVQAGELLGGFAFVDTVGTNYVVFTKSLSKREKNRADGTLRVRHLLVTGDTTRIVRDYTETVRDCPFDIILEPTWGEWSVSDIDADGVGEASFAYSSACVSDVSPIPHKVIVAEGGQKYVLRGETYLAPSDNGDAPEGGTYTADTMPEPFLQAAVRVWETTAHRTP